MFSVVLGKVRRVSGREGVPAEARRWAVPRQDLEAREQLVVRLCREKGNTGRSSAWQPRGRVEYRVTHSLCMWILEFPGNSDGPGTDASQTERTQGKWGAVGDRVLTLRTWIQEMWEKGLSNHCSWNSHSLYCRLFWQMNREAHKACRVPQSCYCPCITLDECPHHMCYPLPPHCSLCPECVWGVYLGHPDLISVPAKGCDTVTQSTFFLGPVFTWIGNWLNKEVPFSTQVPLACPQYLKLIEFKLAQGHFFSRDIPWIVATIS